MHTAKHNDGCKLSERLQMHLRFFPDSIFCRSIPRQTLPAIIAVLHKFAIQYRTTFRAIAPLPVISMLVDKHRDCSLNTPPNQQQLSFAELWFMFMFHYFRFDVRQKIFLRRNSFYSLSPSFFLRSLCADTIPLDIAYIFSQSTQHRFRLNALPPSTIILHHILLLIKGYSPFCG